MLRTTDVGQVSNPIQLLTCIRKELPTLQPLLLSSNGLRAHATVRLIALMGQHSATVPLLATAFLLANASENHHLGAIIAMCQATSATQPTLLADALEQELRWPEGRDHSTLWKNLAILLRHEAKSKPGPIVFAAKRCFTSIADAIRYGNSDAAEVLELALPAPHGVEISLKLTRATITYFFHSLETGNDIERLSGARRSIRLLAKLCSNSLPARALALRELLDGALHQSQSRLFGAVTTKTITPGSTMSSEPSLLKDNQKQGVSALLPQRHSTVFHAGIIGHGPRR
jgi:integrator complex subunit 5